MQFGDAHARTCQINHDLSILSWKWGGNIEIDRCSRKGVAFTKLQLGSISFLSHFS